MKITNPITLDVARSNSYICLLAKQFDENSRFLIATLTNNGEPMIIPAGAAVTLRATRPDGEPVAVPGIINNDGTTTVEIDDYILEVVGSASLSIEVAIGDEILTSASFNLTIQRADGNGWLRVYVAAASLAAGNYYITIGDTPYAFTTTQAIPAGGSVYFASEGGTAQTRDADGNVLDASLPVSIASTGTELTSDVPTMSFLTAIAGRMATIEAEMSQKANIDGSYPLLHAGTADNLMTDNGATQAIPFIQEGTGKGNGEATVKAGGVLQLKKKLGNTVAVNQQVQNPRFASLTIWTNLASVSGGIGTSTSLSRYAGLRQDMSPIVGHTYLLTAEATADSNRDLRLGFFNGASALDGFSITITSGTFTRAAQIVTLSDVANRISLANWSAGSAVIQAKEILCIDLTLWFGSNDRIPSDLLSHPENWGRYYAGSLDYNAGTLESADGGMLTSIHRNIWDEEWEVGGSDGQGGKGSAQNAIISKNYRPAIPNQTYYFYCAGYTNMYYLAVMWYDANKTYLGRQWCCGTTAVAPSNAAFFKIYTNSGSYIYGGTYNHDITISLYYPGEPGYDQYYPFSVLAEVDTGSEVLHGDGTPEHSDSKLPDGTITRKRITYTITGNENVIAWYDNTSAVYAHHYGGAIQIPNLGIAYGADTYGNASNGYLIEYANNNKAIYASLPTRLDILDDSYTTQAAWLAGITGTVLILDVATPTTEQGTAFAENIPCDDFGSMYWTQTKGIPQGNEIFYPADLKGALESIVAALPSANGTYTLHATVTTAGVTFSWS